MRASRTAVLQKVKDTDGDYIWYDCLTEGAEETLMKSGVDLYQLSDQPENGKCH
ncbi:hypothetical protein EHW66_21465 [Erwinia psidii]|uniref:Uncharacterized protein n=1 Tax=Erwinia psidii TaxID=69224 RepID=A0A3N6SBH4_9GAMM|nr:hypothetical protein [Erwinia psidii]MCX8962110.1 hypothetical protein [Erwinia psidii]MCX8967435.1 hypothetical protein [Erwinia psidii]RQM37303.1 hypothetical protein EB241_15135 [Erwinia psidii]